MEIIPLGFPSLVVRWLRICLPMKGTQFSIPGLGGSQLSPCATTTEACGRGARAPQQEKSLQREVRAPQLESSPRLPQL